MYHHFAMLQTYIHKTVPNCRKNGTPESYPHPSNKNLKTGKKLNGTHSHLREII